MTLDIAGYLEMARRQTIAPLLLEVVLKSGRSYYIKNVFERFDAAGLFALRVWDLRALSDDDYPVLMDILNDKGERDAWSEYRSFFPKLDEANLWLSARDVEHIVEWHDRIWPQLAAPEDRGTEPRSIGFRHPDGSD